MAHVDECQTPDRIHYNWRGYQYLSKVVTEEILASLDLLDPAAREQRERAAAFEKWVGEKSPEQQAWEQTLVENLGSYYLPFYQQDKLDGKERAWDYVEDDPKLPRVLLIGDSISRGYTLPVRKELAGKVNLHRAPANCGDTKYGLQKLDVWLGDGKWDLIHFNFGIHDVSHKMTPEQYGANLEKLVERLQKTGAKLVWASSTPLNVDEKKRQAIIEFNAIAAKVMKARDIPIDDLYTAILPHVEEYQTADRTHFDWKGYEYLSKVISEQIRNSLDLQN
ncbi:MAG: SGNH/GDSL hydrolase family protein [Phycisphaerae bacterium]|nr:SGNH/GDSL hydrolase family protein [Phycisphaerae bacterium]